MTNHLSGFQFERIYHSYFPEMLAHPADIRYVRVVFGLTVYAQC